MQPHEDRDDDVQLRGLLREWQVPNAPPSMEQRVLGSRGKAPRQPPQQHAWWRFLFSGYIRVPVSVACGLAILLTAAAWKFAVQPPAPCVAERAVAPASRAALIIPARCEHPAPGVC
jgi:hypothetical protein